MSRVEHPEPDLAVEDDDFARAMGRMYEEDLIHAAEIVLLRPVDAENTIRPLDACTYETCSLKLLADFANPVFVILLLVYDSLPSSPYCPSPNPHHGAKCITLVSNNSS
jgi:hypothetical protein